MLITYLLIECSSVSFNTLSGVSILFVVFIISFLYNITK
nr:MAG TPA: hypothetical protein [Caudoviricetes sp.]DAW71658.1 MAG TPA: hypothetical protein [Caudoviricetes sp.]